MLAPPLATINQSTPVRELYASEQEFITNPPPSIPKVMTTNEHTYFDELAIEHDCITYYANGYVEYAITEGIGGNYEGYAFETVHTSEISHIAIDALWYYDKETGNSVDIRCQKEYGEIEQIAEEIIRDEFE